MMDATRKENVNKKMFVYRYYNYEDNGSEKCNHLDNNISATKLLQCDEMNRNRISNFQPLLKIRHVAVEVKPKANESRSEIEEVKSLRAWRGWSSMVTFTCRAIPRKVRLVYNPLIKNPIGEANFVPIQCQRLIRLNPDTSPLSRNQCYSLNYT